MYICVGQKQKEMDIKKVLMDLHDQFLQHEGSMELFAKSLGLTIEQAYQLIRIGQQIEKEAIEKQFKDGNN